MPKGIKRAILKRQVRKRPAIVAADESAEFDLDFSDLRSDMKRNREVFCREYIKDFNGAQAMRRMGSKSKQPAIRASEWLKHPYTQHYLAILIEKMDEKAIVTRNEVLMGLKREANHFKGLDASSASRISAFRTLAKILGMEVTKIEGNMNIGGGVMLMPFSGSPDEWEKAAAAAQAKLKQAVRQ